VLLVVATTLGAVPTFMIGFIANRYLIDMLPPLIVAGAVGVWIFVALPGRRALLAVAVCLAFWGLWVNASLATWGIEYKTAGFTELRYDIDRTLFGGDPPALVRLVDGMTVPRDGVVAVDPACLGVYMSEQGRWLALERAEGTRRTTGTVTRSDGGIAVLAEAPTWTIRLRRSDDATTLEITDSVGQVLFEQDIDVPETVPYEVIADPVTGEYVAQIGDAAFLLPPEWLVERSDAVTAVSPLCVELTRSLSPEG
jgi:hypothetical protein